ncbi:hypothetical protein [Bradyrhizobium sp. WD16]|nr:hypothetical protein [Bradyrhizobium sp. WD16]
MRRAIASRPMRMLDAIRIAPLTASAIAAKIASSAGARVNDVDI